MAARFIFCVWRFPSFNFSKSTAQDQLNNNLTDEVEDAGVGGVDEVLLSLGGDDEVCDDPDAVLCLHPEELVSLHQGFLRSPLIDLVDVNIILNMIKKVGEEYPV